MVDDGGIDPRAVQHGTDRKERRQVKEEGEVDLSQMLHGQGPPPRCQTQQDQNQADIDWRESVQGIGCPQYDTQQQDDQSLSLDSAQVRDRRARGRRGCPQRLHSASEEAPYHGHTQ